MTVTTFYSPKGGSGTSTVAAAVALGMSQAGSTALVGDLHELCAILGTLPHDGTAQANPALIVLDENDVDVRDESTWEALGIDNVVVDAGTRPEGDRINGKAVLVVRPCFLALRKATQVHRPVVLVIEDGRALGRSDVEGALGVPVEPSIARAIDAGILTSRVPRMLSRALAPIVEGVTTA